MEEKAPTGAVAGSNRQEDVARFRLRLLHHGPALEARARALCQGRYASDPMDLVQETYERALRSFHTYDGSASLMGWLATILMRRFLDKYRNHKRHPHEPLTDELENTFTTTDERSEQWARYSMDDVQQAMKHLPDDLRAVFHMSVLEKQSHAAIARHLGIRPMTVGTRLFRARRRLKKLLLDQQGQS